jgi:hypothetical protein
MVYPKHNLRQVRQKEGTGYTFIQIAH